MSFKELILNAAYILGFNYLGRFITRKQPRILMFHKLRLDNPKFDKESISIELFDELLAYIKSKYQVYTLNELVSSYLDNGRYPKNAVVLTFDDGFCVFIDKALPVLKKHNLKATLFVCPLLIEQGQTIWPERLMDAFEHDALSTADKQSLPQLIEDFKQLNASSRAEHESELLNDGYAFKANSDNRHRSLMSWSELDEVLASGLVEVGSHSSSHPILSNEQDAFALNEIEQSKKLIEHKLNTKVHSFCYPNGQAGDYLPKHIEMLKQSHYLCAVNAYFGLVNGKSSVYELPRIGADFKTMLEARKYVDGLEYLQRKLLERD